MANGLDQLGQMKGTGSLAQNAQNFLNMPQPQNFGDYQLFQIPKYTQGQLGTLESLQKSGQQGLEQNPLNFEPIANLARQQYKQYSEPALMGQFQSMGSGGVANQGFSSAREQALSVGRSDLESKLAALRSQYGLQARGQGLRELELGLRSPYETAFAPVAPQPLTGVEQFKTELGKGLGTGLGVVGSEIGGNALKKLATSAWEKLTGSTQAPTTQQKDQILTKVSDATQGKLNKSNVAAWAPTIAGLISKLGWTGALSLGIPAAIGLAGLLYFAREGDTE